MRVISGTARGRVLRSVTGTKVRPTADRVREALFSVLGSRFDLTGATLLDLFAGTGALGIEALSRGAAHVVFVESDRDALRALARNLREIGFGDRAEVLAMSAEAALRLLARREARFDGAFLDPPYGKGLLEEALASIARRELLSPGAWAMAETHVGVPPAERYGALRLTAVRRYGKTALALFETVGRTESA